MAEVASEPAWDGGDEEAAVEPVEEAVVEPVEEGSA